MVCFSAGVEGRTVKKRAAHAKEKLEIDISIGEDR